MTTANDVVEGEERERASESKLHRVLLEHMRVNAKPLEQPGGQAVTRLTTKQFVARHGNKNPRSG